MEKPIIKSHETIMQDEITTYEELGAILEDIVDTDSAKVAIPALTEIGYKFNRIKTDLQNAEQISAESLKELKADFKIQRRQVLTTVTKHMTRLKSTQPEAYKIATKVISSVTQ